MTNKSALITAIILLVIIIAAASTKIITLENEIRDLRSPFDACSPADNPESFEDCLK